MRASGYHRPEPLKNILLSGGDVSLAHLGDAVKRALAHNGARLPHSVAAAVRGFSLAVEHAVRAENDTEFIRGLIHHHQRVQAGKLDASRQPKLPWVELRGSDVIVVPRYSLDETPRKPRNSDFTHPYRIEQFADMLRETGVWESTS